ncbi:hypothetical protein VSR68_32945 [Paraburkholderia phymatum]|uniref:hypothetical protein n=1 Tax=Paraburkholderia phymatum TaxID=148447 RepID=UPI003171499E
MRNQAIAFAALLALIANGAVAASPSEVLRQQRLHIDNAITARNAMLDRIHFVGHNDDSVQLASINGSELTVEYALQALEGVLGLVHRGSGKPVDLKAVGEPMLMLCQAQVTQMASDSAQLADSRIRDEVEKQIDNVRAACSAIVAVTN